MSAPRKSVERRLRRRTRGKRLEFSFRKSDFDPRVMETETDNRARAEKQKSALSLARRHFPFRSIAIGTSYVYHLLCASRISATRKATFARARGRRREEGRLAVIGGALRIEPTASRFRSPRRLFQTRPSARCLHEHNCSLLLYANVYNIHTRIYVLYISPCLQYS